MPDALVDRAVAPARESLSLGTRWLGPGLAASLAVVTLVLWLTGQLPLYINPEATWWAVSMSIVALVLSVASCAVRLSTADEHDAMHAAEDAEDHSHEHEHAHQHEPQLDGVGLPRRSVFAQLGVAVGAVLASGLVIAALVLPPASLSTQLALERAAAVPPRLATSGTLELASTGDTSSFGIGEWASVMQTTTNPRLYAGDPVTLTGFVGSEETDEISLTRMVIVHCVIDAQAISVPVAIDATGFEIGQWVEVTGTVVVDDSGSLVVQANEATPIDEPADPYEY